MWASCCELIEKDCFLVAKKRYFLTLCRPLCAQMELPDFLSEFRNIGCSDSAAPQGERHRPRRLKRVLFHFNSSGKTWLERATFFIRSTFLKLFKCFYIQQTGSSKIMSLVKGNTCEIMLNWSSFYILEDSEIKKKSWANIIETLSKVWFLLISE